MRGGLIMMTIRETELAQTIDTIMLPPPQMTGSKSLMQVLKARHSTRSFASRPLPLQVMSNLLWAADGVNRPYSAGRTAPTAHDWREIDVVVAMEDGAFRYDPTTHTLGRVATGDLRDLTGEQDYVATAPIDLVYVANLDRMTDAGAEDKAFYSATDAGFIAQNVYLYCASAGLAVVVRGLIDRNALGAALELSSQQRIMLAQSVGYPVDGAR
jgi:nitroreductase